MSLFKKKTAAQAASQPQPVMDMGPMVAMLAKAAEEKRQEMLTDRLTVFAGQDLAVRERGMRAMLEAVVGLPDDEHQTITSSRMAVLQEFPQDQRVTLMKSHAAVAKELPDDLRMKEMRAMKSVIAGLPVEKRQMMEAVMKDLGMMG